MCLLLLAHHAAPRWPLIVAANRDEFRERPTARAAWWDAAPGMLAGRDLRGGGTWMGVTRAGRWAALTNVREMGAPLPDAPSRGELVSAFLRGSASPAAYLAEVSPRAGRYHGFNLLLGDGEQVAYFSNRAADGPRRLAPGVYALSNAALGTAWPKTERGRDTLRRLLDAGDPTPAALFGVLADAEPAADALLPDTGVGRERERALSSLFIDTPEYGTRCSTVLRVNDAGEVDFTERSFAAGGRRVGERRFAWHVGTG